MRAAALVACIAVSLVALSVHAGTFNSVLEIGAAAPDFRDLPGVDGENHSLSDFAPAKALVLVFTCNHCPVAVANEERLIALQRDFASRGVQVVAINVNNLPEDKLEPMKQHAQEHGFNFPYLFDSSQASGRAYGATVTPHVFLLDGQRRVVYMGAIDDNAMEPEKVTKHYLRDAVEAVLAGKAPPQPETRQKGCGIRYDSR